MKSIKLTDYAAGLATPWRSVVLGQAAGSNVKVLRMDGSIYPNEVHDFDEGLLVIEGQMNLAVAGEVIVVNAGELLMVPKGTAHSVAVGSHGTLVIIDR